LEPLNGALLGAYYGSLEMILFSKRNNIFSWCHSMHRSLISLQKWKVLLRTERSMLQLSASPWMIWCGCYR
jgi:hypothetical protein